MKVLEEFSKVIANRSNVDPIFLTGSSMFKVFAITLRKIVNFSLKAKGLTFNLGLVRQSLTSILVFIFLLTCLASIAQDRPESGIRTPAGGIPVKNDTARVAPTDSTLAQPNVVKSDTTKAPKGDIETTINYAARDSIRASMDGKMIWLYGEAKITYGTVEVEAEEIIIDYANNTITAQGTRDSLGNRIGYPIFKNGAELYETKGISYNFKTRRARIREVVTQQGEGFLQSATAFKNEKNEIYSIDNSYTTCNLEHPHFRIRATKTKAIPNDKIVAGPFYVEFNEIPLPIGFLFGMFPAQRESKSGIIFPSYGEERKRGFNFRNGGYFFDISEYMKLSLTGDIYSKGSHAVYMNSAYMKRYHYNGSFNFSYSKNKQSDKIEDESAANDFRLTWSHSPQSKGTGRFSASVNAATSNFNKNNNLMYGAPNDLYTNKLSNISTKLSSNISYNKRFAGTPFSMGINLSHNQDLQTKLVDLPLPNLSLNMTNLYPFQRKSTTGPLDNFSIGYAMVATNRITNQLTPDSIAAFNLENLPLFLRNARKGVRHTIPLSYSFKALKFFTVSPSVSYEEKWYFEKLQYNYVSPENNVLDVDTVDGFNRVANYSFSTSMTTRIYGMYFFKKPTSKIKAIRHIINPSVSFGYTPDFTKNPNYFQRLRKPLSTTNVPPDGTQDDGALTSSNTYYQALHQGFVYGPSTTGKSAAVSFGIGNNLEMKVKGAKDTVDRKVMLLNNLSINSSYNFIADSFKLSNFSIAANTSILDNTININVSSTLDPYYYLKLTSRNPETGVETSFERRTQEYAWNAGQFGRITSATLALSTNLNPKMRNKEQQTREKVAQSDIPDADKQAIIQNPNAYIDFDIPWSANIGYNASYGHTLNKKPSIVQTLSVSGDLSISEKWKITYTTGYDFKAKDFTQSNLGISRDIHCWVMNLNWVPFGRFQSYNFSIHVKASVLQDLKLERRKPFLDNL
jgi:lipopolysaccharide assembly outer membrane protein LptD (OstA)